MKFFIGYTNIMKYIYSWVTKTQPVLLVSSLFINKSKQRIKLLINYLLDISYLTIAKKFIRKIWPGD